MVDRILLGIVVWNIIVFLVYGLDKLLAKTGASRVSEKTLLTLAAVFGAVGAWAGMRVFRHKTRHAKFVYAVPILAFVNLAVIFFSLWGIDK